jgi:uncharacterized protein YdeI (YjbR/CyaY-like superfamily)
MKELEFIHFKNTNSFHKWLQKNHKKCPGIWMVYYKKHTNTECISYDEALDEALCFGWIDSIIKKIDDDKYARKFTPRIDTKNWSDTNKKKINGLVKSGRMTEAGLNKIDIYLKTGKLEWGNKGSKEKTKKEIAIPDHILNAFARNEPALRNFNELSASCQRQYLLWIMNAKRAETIQKRIDESVVLLKKNKKLGLK